MNLPTSWKQVTIKQYLEIDTIVRSPIDQVDKDIQILASLTGQSPDDILALSFQKKRKALKKIAFLNSFDTINKRMVRRFSLGGKRFYIPRFHELTGGQYIDMMSFCKQSENEQIHNILAVVCLPYQWFWFKKKYSGLDHKQRAELLLHLPMSTAYPVLLFFCNLWETLMQTMPGFLAKQLTKMESLLQNQTTAASSGGL